jgi:hypothetical protein
MKPEEGRAFLNHNRDIGMLAKDRMVVLGLNQGIEFYGRNPKQAEMALIGGAPSSNEEELEKDTISLFQVADDLYMHRKYAIDGLSQSETRNAQPTQPATSQAWQTGIAPNVVRQN